MTDPALLPPRRTPATRVAVVGSANVDLVYRVARIPRPGETVLALDVDRVPGGKGQNQAIAAARSGARTAFVAAIGEDENGALVRDALRDAGVDASRVRVLPEATGTAIIAVEDSGENAIMVAAGANGLLSEPDPADLAVLGEAAIVVAQLEIPVPTVLAAARAARAAGARVVLNAAPVRPLPDELWEQLDVLVVNEQEAEDYGAAVQAVPSVVVTLGGDGADVYEAGELVAHVAAPRVVPVDTTGAGDTFVGALAARLAEGAALADAARWAVVAASISVERPGAVPSIPTRAEVEARIELAR